jgi:hypothetical protein
MELSPLDKAAVKFVLKVLKVTVADDYQMQFHAVPAHLESSTSH